MKTLTILISILTAMLISSVVLANDADSARIEKKIIKTIMMTDDGEVIIDSTYIIEGGKVTVHVDSIKRNPNCPRHNGNFKHIQGDPMMFGNDEMNDEYIVNVEMEGDSTRAMVIGNPRFKHEKIGSEGENRMMNKKMMIHNADGIPCPPPPPVPPLHGKVSGHKGMIDLNDPSIISYEKKVQKDGTEKITIIRNIN